MQQPTTTESCPALEAFRAKNNARQKKFYEANREEMNKKRRERYALGKTSNVVAVAPPTPEIVPVPVSEPTVAAKIVRKRKVKESVVAPDVAPVVAVAPPVTAKPSTKKRTVGTQGAAGYIDLSEVKAITLDDVNERLKTIISDDAKKATLKKYMSDTKTLFKV